MSWPMWLLAVLDGLSPTLWAALFLGVFGLLLICCRDEDRKEDDE
jgi:hypothetical protein